MKHKRNKALIITSADRPGNHIPKLMEAICSNPASLGTLCRVQVAHDGWCSLLVGKGPCNCDPEVHVFGIEQ